MSCETEILGDPEATPDLQVFGILVASLVLCFVSVVFLGCFCVRFLCFGLPVGCFFLGLLSVCCFFVASWARRVDIFFVIFSALRAQLAVAGGFGGFGLGYIFQRKFCQGLVTGQSMTKFILKNASSIEILSKIMPIWAPWGHQGPRTPRDAVEVAKR